MLTIDTVNYTVTLAPGWLCEPGGDDDVISASLRRKVVRLPAGWTATIGGVLVWPPGLE